MSADYECPSCGGSYQRISQHWTVSSCEHPPIDAALRATVEGFLLAGASIRGAGRNDHLRIGTVNGDLAAWAGARLGWLLRGVSIEERRDGSDVNRVRTHAHPTLSAYRDWFDDDGTRRPPADLEIGARTARAWYAFAGTLEWHGEVDTQRSVAFSALRDHRAAWIASILERAGYEPARTGKRVQLPPTSTDRWLGWLGDPVPGVEYKWASERAEFRELKDG